MRPYDVVWREVFDRSARLEGEVYEKTLHGSASEERSQIELVLSLLDRDGNGAGKKVLDVGCGVGRYLSPLRDRGYTVHGCDYSWDMISQSRKASGVWLAQAHVESLPYLGGTFDVVLSIGVLQTVVDHERALTELYRILKPGGVLILSTLRSPSIWELPLFPAVELMMCDQSILTGQWYPRLIKDRKGLSWHNRPRENRARRYKMGEINDYLLVLGFNDVRHFYLGRIRKIPILINSQLVTFSAIKSK